MSHPTWVRGLKLCQHRLSVLRSLSHPTWVRGLKLRTKETIKGTSQSHPTWVRGLKQEVGNFDFNSFSRTLRGCVD